MGNTTMHAVGRQRNDSPTVCCTAQLPWHDWPRCILLQVLIGLYFLYCSVVLFGRTACRFQWSLLDGTSSHLARQPRAPRGSTSRAAGPVPTAQSALWVSRHAKRPHTQLTSVWVSSSGWTQLFQCLMYWWSMSLLAFWNKWATGATREEVGMIACLPCTCHQQICCPVLLGHCAGQLHPTWGLLFGLFCLLCTVPLPSACSAEARLLCCSPQQQQQGHHSYRGLPAGLYMPW